MLVPRPLAPGDRVAIVAPSGPFDADVLRAGLARLEERYRLVLPPSLLGRRHGYFAGDDEERRSELQAALDDESLGAIWIARGGYGLARILPSLDFSSLERVPRWLIGFSDVTTLHLAWARRGGMSLHGPNVTSLARASEGELERTFALLAGGSTQLPRLRPLSGPPFERLEGPLVGGNLTVVFAEAVAGRLAFPEGSLVFLEDVSETSYRVDRMLTALLQGGHLATARAVVLGDFTDCSPGRFGVPVADTLRDCLGSSGLPILEGLPLGHGSLNEPLPHGASARLERAADGTFTLYAAAR